MLRVLTTEPVIAAFRAGSTIDERFASVGKNSCSFELDSEDRYSTQQNQELMRRLLSAIQGWYDEIVTGIERLRTSEAKWNETGDDRYSFDLVYVWRRNYVTSVVSITNILEGRSGMRDIVRAMDAFLAKLTTEDWRDSKLDASDSKASRRSAYGT